eukprot:c18054_g1_i1.p1 GENE.c18054_g1_i1~~c18054_g1_i1.p1  ORF type:complete len:526 (+),score=233.85 c18054_g1_i1:46-1623(+)
MISSISLITIQLLLIIIFTECNISSSLIIPSRKERIIKSIIPSSFLEKGSDSFESELNEFEDPSDVEEKDGIVVHKHHHVFGVNSLLQKQPTGKVSASDQSNTRKKKNRDPSVEAQDDDGFGPYSRDRRSGDNYPQYLKYKLSPFKNRNNYTGRYEGKYRRERPWRVREGGLMQGKGYDFFNTLTVDDPDLKSEKGTSIRVDATVIDSDNSALMDKISTEEKEEPPPRATQTDSGSMDKTKTGALKSDQPKAVADKIEFQEPIYSYPTIKSPAIADIPTTLIPEEYRTNEFLKQAFPEIQLPNGCSRVAGETVYHDCIGTLLVQVSAAPIEPCLFGGKNNGKDCAMKDLSLGLMQGFASGWTYGAKELINSYMKAYSQSYLEAYDAAFVNGKEVYLGEKAAGEAGSEYAGVQSEKAAGLGNRPGSGGASGPVPIKSDAADFDETSAAADSQESSQRLREEEEQKEKIKEDPEGQNAAMKQKACEDAKKAKKNHKDTHIINPGPTYQEQKAENEEACETGQGVSVE